MSKLTVLLGMLAGIGLVSVLSTLFVIGRRSAKRKRISKESENHTDGLQEEPESFADGALKQFELAKEAAAHHATNGKVKTKEAVEKIIASVK